MVSTGTVLMRNRFPHPWSAAVPGRSNDTHTFQRADIDRHASRLCLHCCARGHGALRPKSKMNLTWRKAAQGGVTGTFRVKHAGAWVAQAGAGRSKAEHAGSTRASGFRSSSFGLSGVQVSIPPQKKSNVCPGVPRRAQACQREAPGNLCHAVRPCRNAPCACVQVILATACPPTRPAVAGRRRKPGEGGTTDN